MLHPDKNPELSRAEEAFKRLKEAAEEPPGLEIMMISRILGGRSNGDWWCASRHA